MDLWTKMILRAVQRWPLKLRDPRTHSRTVTSMFASGKTIAGSESVLRENFEWERENEESRGEEKEEVYF